MSTLRRSPAPGHDNFRVARVAAPLRQGVVASIRNAIISGRFAAGERMTEKDLCEMTGVSRTLVREALRQLEAEGLVHVVPNRGPVVAGVTMAQAREIYQLRRELEGLASELFAVNATTAEQDALQAAFEKLQATIETSEPSHWLAIKNQFYACLLRGGGNETLAQMLGLLNTRITVLRATSLQHRGRAHESVAELKVVVAALLARDAEAARKAMHLHVDNAARTSFQVLAERPEV